MVSCFNEKFGSNISGIFSKYEEIRQKFRWTSNKGWFGRYEKTNSSDPNILFKKLIYSKISNGVNKSYKIYFFFGCIKFKFSSAFLGIYEQYIRNKKHCLGGVTK